MLTLLLLIPIIGVLFTLLAGRVNATGARVAALISSVFSLQVAYLLTATARYRVVEIDRLWIPSFGVHFALRADWVSALMVLLTSLLTVFAIAVSWKEIKDRVTSFHVWILLLQVGVTLVFLARDLMLFYLGWELMIIPMLFLIGSWGTGRKEYSAFKFVLFTFTGSIFMLASMLYLFYRHLGETGTASFDMDHLLTLQLTYGEQWWVFLGFLIGFGVKAPLLPLHTWLVDAYPNAPTAGSLLLSGILSKTGVYGLFALAIPFAPDAFATFKPLLIWLAVAGIFYGAWIAFTQRDIKRLIAYSSFSHVSFILLGIFIASDQGFQGGLLQMINHGITTAGLFLIAGAVQDRLQTREFPTLGGLWRMAPAMGAFMLFFAFASLGLPGTGNFVGELYIIASALSYHWLIGGLASLAVFFAAIYSLRLFTGMFHGPQAATVTVFSDTDDRENLLLTSLAALLILLGFFPSLVTAPLKQPPASAPAAVSASAPTSESQIMITMNSTTTLPASSPATPEAAQ
jgi:NADH-quinone oxidoreductase subunit M